MKPKRNSETEIKWKMTNLNEMVRIRQICVNIIILETQTQKHLIETRNIFEFVDINKP